MIQILSHLFILPHCAQWQKTNQAHTGQIFFLTKANNHGLSYQKKRLINHELTRMNTKLLSLYNRKICRPSSVAILVMALAFASFAEPVRNGNELALCFSTNTLSAKLNIQKAVTKRVLTFRFLKVTEIKKDTPMAGAFTLVTKEPSSDMKVLMVLTKPLSIKLASTVSTGECVAAKGRVKSIGVVAPDMIVLAPAILQHKDRCGPKLSKELLREIDSSAY